MGWGKGVGVGLGVGVGWALGGLGGPGGPWGGVWGWGGVGWAYPMALSYGPCKPFSGWILTYTGPMPLLVNGIFSTPR